MADQVWASTIEGRVGELGVGGVDLAPQPGSPAALHQEKLLAHPTRYTAIATLGGVAKVLVPLLIAALIARFAVNIPWPDLPSIPWPDIPWPGVSWPDLPSIPWPDIPWPGVSWPDVSLPGWLGWILGHAKYIGPALLAYVLARAEIKRRRKHADEMVAQRRGSITPANDTVDKTDEGGASTS